MVHIAYKTSFVSNQENQRVSRETYLQLEFGILNKIYVAYV